MLFKPKGTEAVVASRARDQAVWLIRDHGKDAEAVLAAKFRRDDVSAIDLYRYRLTARELKRLRAAEASGTFLTLRKPHWLSVRGLLRLLGLRKTERRRRPRD